MSHATNFRWLFFELPPYLITTLFSGITTLSPELPPYFRELPPYFRNYHVIYSNSFHHSKGSLKEILKELVENALQGALSKIYLRVFFRIPVVPHLLRLFGDRRTEPVKPVPMVVTHAPSLQLRIKNNSG